MTLTAKKVDLTEFYRLSRPKKPPCQVGNAREQLTEEEQTQLDAALAQAPNVITAKAIVEWLERRGHALTSPNPIVNHRSRKCSCHEPAA